MLFVTRLRRRGRRPAGLATLDSEVFDRPFDLGRELDPGCADPRYIR